MIFVTAIDKENVISNFVLPYTNKVFIVGPKKTWIKNPSNSIRSTSLAPIYLFPNRNPIIDSGYTNIIRKNGIVSIKDHFVTIVKILFRSSMFFWANNLVAIGTYKKPKAVRENAI